MQPPKDIFDKYIKENKLIVESDNMYGNERYKTFLFDSKSSYDQLKEEVEECVKEHQECMNNISVEYLKEGYIN